MRLVHFCKNSRYSIFVYPFTSSIVDALSSNGYSLFPHYFNSTPSKSLISSIYSTGSISAPQIGANLWVSHTLSSRCFNSSAKSCTNLVENDVSNGDINSVIDLIRGDESDMESKLDSIGFNISRFVLEILDCLNLLRVPALRFFTWLKNAHSSYSRNSDICSLVFANCGLLGDYDAMLNLLIDFRNRRVCLNEKAFRFLPISSSNMDMTKKSVTEVIGLLNHVGGVCRNSGVHSLVEMLCSFSSFDLAKYVVQIAEKKVSHYRVLVKHLCISGKFNDARNLLEEMRRVKCEPDSKTYNYFISSLCKRGSIEEAFAVGQEMLSRGCLPNLMTFEMLIYFGCKCDRSDQAVMFWKEMVPCGVKPRLSTHYAFIRGYFRSQKFDKAYRYVICAAAVDKCSTQDMYNVLANLHVNEGDLLVAHSILVEMLEKGLKPRHSMFLRAMRCLHKIGKEFYVKDLKARYYSRDVE